MRRTVWPRLLGRNALAICVVFGAATAHAQSHLVRMGDIQGDSVGAIEIAALGDERVVTAVTDAAGDLKLTVWDVTADGKLTRRDSSTAGKASVFATAALGSGSVVTAVRQENGNLRLIDWAVDAAGTISRKGQIDAGPVDRVEMAVAGPSRVVTATVESGHTKLIVWDVSGAGQLTRRGSLAGVDGTRAAVTALSATRLALAVKAADGKLAVSSWSVNQAGTLAALKTTKGSAVSDVAITNTALDRAITACRLADGTLQVAAWDVDGAGNVSQGGSAAAGAADHVAVTAMGSTRVVTALRDTDHQLKLITWQVIDSVRRLDSIAAGEASQVAAVALGWDRVVAAVRDSENKLKLIDYADFSVGLLRGQWGPSASVASARAAPTPAAPAPAARAPAAPASAAPAASAPPEATDDDVDDERLMLPPIPARLAVRRIDRSTELAEGRSNVPLPAPSGGAPPPGPPPAQVQSPAPSLVFFPDISGVDPMIAVGRDFVVVSQDHWIEFLYKTGPKAGKQLDSKAGESTRLSSKDFFNAFFAAQNPDGTTNRHNVNLHLRFPPAFDAAVACTPPSTVAPCMNEAYDTRVIYDPYRGRFVIMSAIRGVGMSGATTLVARRYVAIAVSRTEDPRDGFHQYMTTESNYSDWPRIASSDGVLVVAHNACKSPDAIDTCGSDHQNIAMNAMALRPMAYVYRIDDMIANQPAPRSWKIYPYQVGGGTFYPVAHHGATDGWTYLVKPSSSLDIYAFKQPLNGWEQLPDLKKTSFALDGGTSGFREAVHFRGGKLYFASGVSVADRVPNEAPARWHVRAVRIPISTSGGLKAGPCPSTPGCLDTHFGLHALEDAPEDELSYDMPSLVPDKDGNMILVYGRVPVKMKHPIGQEARFSIIYDDARGLLRSRLIQAGGVVLKDKYCSGSTVDTTATAENYWHVWYGGDTCSTQKHYLDYGTAAVDPDGKSFWIVHAYADAATNRFKMVGAKVVP